MIILGVNSYHPDSSAAIVIDGKLVAACEEERFSRVKHFSGFPEKAIRFCLRQASVSLKDVNYIAVPRKRNSRIFKKAYYGLLMPKLLLNRLNIWTKIFDIRKDLALNFDIDQTIVDAKLFEIEHHLAHMSSSFCVSGFEKSLIISFDALGDFASTVVATGQDTKIKPLSEVTFPHSLGFYYTAITQYLGFNNFGDEYKVMGLAPYGNVSYKDEFTRILKVKGKSFKLGLEYFLHHKNPIDMNFSSGTPEIGQLFSSYLERRLGPKRKPQDPITQKHKDIAATLQNRLEEVAVHFANSNTKKEYTNLCLAGGVAHNCALNGKLLHGTTFRKIYVPPAPGDAGLSVGAAFCLHNQISKKPNRFHMHSAYWGSEYNEKNIMSTIQKLHKTDINSNISTEIINSRNKLCEIVALNISQGRVVGWFQGRSEFGPRALGNRSILADPRRADMKDILNSKIKLREVFRPFAPSILNDYVSEYFYDTNPSPFMSFVYKIREDKQKSIPAVCHIDGTARPQTVGKEVNPLYYNLISAFKDITGIPILLNTSFNENEPIINSPEEALNCFLRTNMDMLVLGDFIIKRNIK